MQFDRFKKFSDLDLHKVSKYEIEEYGEELPYGINYWQISGKIKGFLYNSTLITQYDADIFFEEFYNFIVDLRDNYEYILDIILN